MQKINSNKVEQNFNMKKVEEFILISCHDISNSFYDLILKVFYPYARHDE